MQLLKDSDLTEKAKALYFQSDVLSRMWKQSSMFYCSGFQSAVFMFYRTEEVIGVGVFLQRVFPYTVSLVGLTLGITDDVSTVPSPLNFTKRSYCIRLCYVTIMSN